MEATDMQRRSRTILFAVLALTLASGMATRAGGPAPADRSKAERIARGGYLVTFGGCHDCHTPLKIGPNGPEPDMTRALSGHPADFRVTPPAAPGRDWMAVGANTMTAWSGPWGMSFTANLTPDKETGLGNWTEDMFITALRTGRHEGRGRPILPPMPWRYAGSLTDADLKAVFAYLQSLPPVRNKVPAPLDPPEEGAR
jgi:mono/diheme cytochrome c family protein